jgi:LemA protein
MVAIIIIIAIIVFAIGYVISISNGLNRAIIKIDEANSDIDVSLTKRYDVLTKMIDVVKGYAKYEQETIFKTVELRKNMTIKEKNEANELMEENMEKINVIAENYPDLKASENYKTLQKAIADVEEHLQASRRLYNANVSSYNQKIVTFPSSIIANSKGLTKKDFFTVENKKREDVKIEL